MAIESHLPFPGVRTNVSELLILAMLCHHDMYGYEIARELEIVSEAEGYYDMDSPRIYLFLLKLVKLDYAVRDIVTVGKRRERVYYHMNDNGKEFFLRSYEEYKKINHRAIAYIESLEIVHREPNLL